MNAALASVVSALTFSFRSRLVLQAEILALRHQVNVLQRSAFTRRKLRTPDRILRVWLSRLWPDWRSALLIVKPEKSSRPTRASSSRFPESAGFIIVTSDAQPNHPSFVADQTVSRGRLLREDSP
jgi:hypothetical protein